MQFNVCKCKVMHVSRKSPRVLYTLRNNGLQIVEVENDIGVMISSDLKCTQQCMYAYTRINRVVGRDLYSCTKDITKYYFSTKAINRWNLLHQRMVDAQHQCTQELDGLSHGLVH